ncbi:MAG: type II toxin-antitoxin system HipA family toxin [Chloroflexi bacterium]|nr:type II toxin-antitoxin system HipA family toxin [Chloroflexota bacterium]
MTTAEVKLWGRTIGAVTWDPIRKIGVFQYSPDFIHSRIQLSPIMMPLSEMIYEFPNLSKETFRGLPGLLSDSLPDKFGNLLINTWLSTQGRNISDFSPVERLCYVGRRGMGALEFEPAITQQRSGSQKIEVANLVNLSNLIINQRGELKGIFTDKDDKKSLEDILRVGTSAGGARAKAILAWNPSTNEFQSGQLPAKPGFEQWILKFDGIFNKKDKELSDPQGYGKIEYAYHLMAAECGITMMPCRIYKEGGRCHFMTKRFDRTDDGQKNHMQSLCAITHADFNEPAAFSYEETIITMKKMELSRTEIEQLILRAMFNIVARNQDDHVKNIAFLMNPDGNWSLSPAFDISYSYDPQGYWTSQHQMVLNFKRDNFTLEDFIAFASIGGVKRNKTNEMLENVIMVVKKWDEFATAAEVENEQITKIHNAHRLVFFN